MQKTESNSDYTPSKCRWLHHQGTNTLTMTNFFFTSTEYQEDWLIYLTCKSTDPKIDKLDYWDC